MDKDIFEVIVDYEKLHNKLKMLIEHDIFNPEVEILRKWARNYYDKDGKFIEEFQTTYYSSVWELYLSEILRNLGFEQDTTKDRPDFRLISPYKFDIEAVVSNVKVDGRKEETRNMRDALEMFHCIFKKENFGEILDEAITRHSNSINYKHMKYKNDYRKCQWIDDEVPFVLALGSYDQMKYGREFIFPMVALLYGDYYNSESKVFQKQNVIRKPGTEALIPLGLFNDSSYSEISAIMFSCTMTIGKLTSLALSENEELVRHNKVINVRYDTEIPKFKLQIVDRKNPETIFDGLFIFHNPNAKNPLPQEVFQHSDIMQITCEKNRKHKLLFDVPPIVARVDFPAVLQFRTLSEAIDILNYEYNRK